MTIRTRMTFWFTGILLVSVVVIASLLVDELNERQGNGAEHAEKLGSVISLVCWTGIPTIVLSFAGGAWMMRKALTPIAGLTRAAERINENNLGDKLPRTGNGDELDRLAEVLNAMTARLHDSFKQIREFTLHASHELKTPLTVLRGETEMELSDESISAAGRERASSRLEELCRLTRIVDGLTLLAKADAGLIALEQSPVALDELVRDSFGDTRVLAQASVLSVELKLCEPVLVQGDAHRLRQLLLNLSDNAVKYNQPNGTITMELRRAGSFAEFSITNTGPGIGSASLSRVFDRFYRGDTAHCRQVDGCGLGLSIAKWIVSAHRAAMRIESDPGKLTKVTICFPLAVEVPGRLDDSGCTNGRCLDLADDPKALQT
jgi:signal transduction histidine kinase